VTGTDPRASEQVVEAASGLSRMLGNQVSPQVDFVDSLPHTGGKIKFATSDLEEDGSLNQPVS